MGNRKAKPSIRSKLIKFFILYLLVDFGFGIAYYKISQEDDRALITQSEVGKHFSEQDFKNIEQWLEEAA